MKQGSRDVVREAYTKIWNVEVANKGGSQQILDSDRAAIFRAEGGNWSTKTNAELGPDVIPGRANQAIVPFGDLKVWLRTDGALARMTGAPQASCSPSSRPGNTRRSCTHSKCSSRSCSHCCQLNNESRRPRVGWFL